MTDEDASGKTPHTDAPLHWEPILQAFEKAWQSGQPPDIKDFLRVTSDERPMLLVELVHTELEYRLKVGEMVRVEDYLPRFPELEANGAALVELIEAEYTHCHALGRTPQVQDYLRRFPQLQTTLTDRLRRIADGTEPRLQKESPRGVEPPTATAEQARQRETFTAMPGVAPNDGATVPQRDTDGQRAADFSKVKQATIPTLPGYEILDVLGRGGMGVVYRARQTRANRVVALKMILAGAHAGPGELERFRTEAEAIARVQHPHIVQIFEVGEHDGLPFFSLEYCGGGTLDKSLQGTPLQPTAAAKLIETLARAIHLAHAKGIIHRDLKPANVLLTPEGTPKITDFGLAKKLDQTGLTGSGAVIGTPSYMSPEQAGGRSHEVGPATDIHALGALLYECLTGRPPYKAATPLDTLLLVVQSDPVSPASLNAKLPRDLETICLKCLQKSQAKRYATALELAEDLRRFQANEPIAARPASMLEKGLRWAKRKPAQAVALAVSFIAAVVLLGGGAWFSNELRIEGDNVREERDNAEKARESERERATDLATALQKTKKAEKAEKARAEELKKQRDQTNSALQESQRNLNRSRILLAQHAWNYSASAEFANHYLRLIPPSYRNWEWGYLKRKYEGSLFTLYGHGGPVTSVSFSGDGSRIASGACDRTVRVWDAKSGQALLKLKGHTDAVSSVSFSGDGSRIASGAWDSTVRVWDANTGQALLELKGHTKAVMSVSFSGDGSRIASGSRDGTVRVWDAKSGQALLELNGYSGPVAGVSFSGDGSRIASGSEDRKVLVWDTKSGKALRRLTGHISPLESVSFSADGTRIATREMAGILAVWDAISGQAVVKMNVGSGSFDKLFTCSVSFSGDGSRIATISGDKTVRVLDAKSGQAVLQLIGNADSVTSVSFSADGTRIASGDMGGTVRVWDAKSGQAVPQLNVGGAPNRQAALLRIPEDASVSFSADGTCIARSDRIGIRVWDAKSGKTLWEVKGHNKWFGLPLGKAEFDFKDGVRVNFSGDNTRIATSGYWDNTVRVWDAKSGKVLLELKGHGRSVESVNISNDGSRIASLTDDGTVRVWDAISGKHMLELKLEGFGDIASLPGFQPTLSFSGDGSRIASISIFPHQAVRVWDAKSGKALLDLVAPSVGLVAPSGFFGSVTFSGDGSLIAAGVSNAVQVWDAKNGQGLLQLKGHTDRVYSVSFSGDGSRIVSGSADGTVRIWDTKTGQALLELKGHAGGVTSVSFIGDGSRIASSSWDGTVRIWDASQAYLELWGNTGWVTTVSYSSDSSRIATSSRQNIGPVFGSSPGDYPVRVWDAKSGQALLELKGHTEEVTSVSFSGDGSRIASASFDKTVRVWDAKSGQALLELKGHTEEVMSVSFSGDGSRIASGSADKTARVWDAKNGQALLELKGHTEEVTSVSFSGDGSRIASGSADKTVRVWDAKTGQALLELEGQTHPVSLRTFSYNGSAWIYTDPAFQITGETTVSFSGDGSRVFSTDEIGNRLVWDTKTGQRLVDEVVDNRKLSPDGKFVAIASGDTVVIIPTQISEDERLRRLWLTRPDPDWHVQKAKEFDQEQNAYAAQLHRSWEQHARGVLAFEACQFDKAQAHFLAAAALKPLPPAAGK